MDDLAVARLTVQVVEAFAAHSRLGVDELVAVIASVHRSLAAAILPPAEAAELTRKPTSARIRRSVQHDHLTSFEDGRPYKTLTRHLRLRGLTPAAYRTKWGLPPDYPMTAASYSETRSAVAKSSGLGRRPSKTNS